MKKILTFILALFIITALSVTAFANESDVSVGENGAQSAPVTEDEPQASAPDVKNASDGQDGTKDTENAEYESVLDTVAGFITENSAEILSLMTFIGSLVLALTYKRGLLPKLSSALVSIGGSVGNLTESTERSVEEISKRVDSILSEGKSTEKACIALGENVSTLAEKLEEIKSDSCNIKEFRLILSSQVDMLYDIFMSSALPQYSKDAVFEKISAMKEALSKDVTTNA